MPYAWRSIRPLLWVALLLTLTFSLAAPASFAQDEQPQPIIIQGSQQLETLVSALRDAYLSANPDAPQITIDPQGPNRGFEALCQGQADLVMSTTPITDPQIRTCNTQGVNFIETVIAYEAVVLLPAPEAEITCLTEDQIANAWQSGSPQDVLWSDLGSTTLTNRVGFYGPEDFAAAYELLREQMPAEALRNDIITTQEIANILTKVQETGAGAFGFMSLADWQRLDPEAQVTPLSIQNDDGECIPPTLGTVEGRTYPYSRAAYLYVNATSAARPEVQAFMTFVLTHENGAPKLAAQQGYTVPDVATFEYGLNNVLNGSIGRTFTRPVTPVNVSTAETGTISVVGSSLLLDLTSSIQREFTTRYLNATIESELLGNTAGWQAFCSGDADVLQATRPATEDELALCAENGIEPYGVDFGYQALVVVVPTGNDWLDCLTSDQAARLLAAGTEETPAVLNWQELDADWPDRTLLIVAPPRSTGETDFLLANLVKNPNLFLRADLVENRDPLYRAQGVANTAQDAENPSNAITYLWWSDLQRSTAEVKVLAVDTGSGCVAPDLETIADGTYPLSFTVRYYFNPQKYETPLVRAFLWHFYDKATLDLLKDKPFAGLDVDALRTTQRDAVFAMLTAWEEAHAAAVEEPTPAATDEPAPVATEAATPVATEEVTPAATEEPAPTAEATEAAQ